MFVNSGVEASVLKVLEKREKLFLAFLDLEKAYDRVPREVVYWSMRKRGIPEKYVRLGNDNFTINLHCRIQLKHVDSSRI